MMMMTTVSSAGSSLPDSLLEVYVHLEEKHKGSNVSLNAYYTDFSSLDVQSNRTDLQ